MTSKMQSCVDHIKTSCDVDPWAMEMVEEIFTEYGRRFDKVLEIIDKAQAFNGYTNGYAYTTLNYVRRQVEALKRR